MPPNSDPHSKAFWSPDAGFTQLVQGSWNGKPVEKQVSTFSSPSIRNIWVYASGGSHLPTTRDDYARQLNIDLSTIPDLSIQVGELVKAYEQAQTYSTAFNNLWKSLVDLSGEIYNFTKIAGGTVDSSYYAGIMQSLNDYNTAKKRSPPDTGKMKEAAEAVVEFTEDLVPRTANLVTSGKTLITAVDGFGTNIYSMWASLNSTLEDIKRRLDPVEVRNLSIIDGLQKTSLDQRVEYHYDVIASGKDWSYALCPLFGVLPETSASAYGPRASAIKNVVQAIQNEIKTEDKKVLAARTVASDAQQAVEDNYAIRDPLQGTTDAIKAIQVGWERISTDLQYLHDAAKGDTIPDVEFGKDFILQTIDVWNQFGKSGLQASFLLIWYLMADFYLVDDFRQTAYISQVEPMTIDQWVEKIGQ
ncbi:uncharacterized protein N7511_009572 [Penicillium nucicola]|uniref:uncharacterized protein n=1 Tax=Penicillium nucicola TaxID=1850975 RepID=UPI00254517D4|nr:uncharacterized protein N7511_009572 [Penicillium nucicola]KAJ5747876.1 hypothetical protein N7511_009572 [Penicillium nucicola]